jgi:GT2 family glycosyltransferase/glycosyltransferase involved in cell wall biosynthesis
VSDRIIFPTEPDPVVSIIVIGWRQAPFLLGCLRSVESSVRRVRYEVVLVLNEPDPALLRSVEQSVQGAVTLRTRVNLGFAGCVNFAARRARGEFLVLLNDDTEVDSGWLEALVDTANRRPEAAAIGSTMLFPDGTIQEAGSIVWNDGSTLTVGRGLPGDAKAWDFERHVDYCSGGSLLIRKALFDELGGLDEGYFPAYYEEADFCLRLAAIDQQVWYQPRSRVVHQESASTNEVFRSFLFARNKLVFQSRFPEVLAVREEADPLSPIAIERAVWAAMRSPKQILLIDDQVAEPWIGSGYPRMADTVSDLLAAGYHVVMFTSLIDGHIRNDAMSALGVRVLDGWDESDLRHHLENPAIPFSAVLISRPHNYERFAPVIRELQSDLPIVYDAESLFSRRLRRQAEMSDSWNAERLRAEADAMALNEAAIARDADALVSISIEERSDLQVHANGPVYLHGPLLSGIEVAPRGFVGRAHIGFVAGWAAGADSPNADALLWFARDVLPKIRARVPGAKLLVTGIGPPNEVLRLAGPSIEFVGSVENLADFYDQVRVVVVPMRFGAGVKIKTIEALQYGVPVVATEVGSEGVVTHDPRVLLVTNDPSAYALHVATLLSDRDAWDDRRGLILDQVEMWEASRNRTLWADLISSTIARGRIAELAIARGSQRLE